MNRLHYLQTEPLPAAPRPRKQESRGIADLLEVLWTNRRLISGSIASALVLASLYYLLAPTTYSAQAQLMFDPKLPSIFREASDLGLNVDSGQVETHIVALKSRAIALAVVKKLGLANDPEFQRKPSFFSHFMTAQGTKGSREIVDTSQVAADIFLDHLRVERDGISQVIEISYYAGTPEKAALLANETAKAYMQYLIDVRAESARIASDWLEERLKQLRLQMNAAAKRAQNYRASAESASLEELQLSAETYRKVYQDFYSAFTEAVQRESYPVSTVRFISEATVSLRPYSPNFILVFGSALLIGAALGLLLAIVRENRRERAHSVEKAGAAAW